MRHLSRRTVLLSALAAPAVARASDAWAQGDFPSRSIRLVIPWPPGASADAFLRTIADASGWIPLVQSGKFRLLVVWGSQRMKLFPEVRTLKEAGIDLEVNSPYGVCGPKGLDAAIVKKVHDAMKEALFDPATQAVMATYNMPTLYLDTASYDKAARAQNQIEIDNLKRVGMLAKQ